VAEDFGKINLTTATIMTRSTCTKRKREIQSATATQHIIIENASLETKIYIFMLSTKEKTAYVSCGECVKLSVPSNCLNDQMPRLVTVPSDNNNNNNNNNNKI